MDQNKRFCELAGIRWYDWENSQGFTHAPILEVMMKRSDFSLFMAKLQYGMDQEGVEGIDWDHSIDIDYILTPYKLRDVAIQWMEEHNGQ
jgi:hypothetical protein